MEQRYQAVLAVVQDGWKVVEVADRLGVSRQTVHNWIARYEQAAWPHGTTVHGDRTGARTRPAPTSTRSSASFAGSIPAGDRAGSSIISPGPASIRCPAARAPTAVSSVTA